jgi:uncharacterized protein DUF5818
MRVPPLPLLLLVASLCGCAPQPVRTAPLDTPPRAGDFVRLRGTLSEDVDCRLFRADDGRTYSLSVRLPRMTNGTKVCIYGTLSDATQCLRTPMIEVESVRAWGACP